MLNVTINNAPKNINKKRIKAAISFYSNRLIGERMSSNISLTISFAKKNSNDVCWEDDNLRPRDFSIGLSSLQTTEEVLLVLAHEMIHVKQYVKGELKDYLTKPDTYWFGKPYSRKKTNYFDLPWEKEAYEKETKLYEDFLNEESYNSL